MDGERFRLGDSVVDDGSEGREVFALREFLLVVVNRRNR